LDCVENMSMESDLKDEVLNLNLEHTAMVPKIEKNKAKIADSFNSIHIEDQNMVLEKSNLQNEKESHLTKCNNSKELKHKTETIRNETLKLKEKVVEDPEETLRKKDDSKFRLENSTNELSKNSSKLSELKEHFQNCKLKAEIATEFAERLGEIIAYIREINE